MSEESMNVSTAATTSGSGARFPGLFEESNGIHAGFRYHEGEDDMMPNKPHAVHPAMALLISTLSHRRGVPDAERSAQWRFVWRGVRVRIVAAFWRGREQTGGHG